MGGDWSVPGYREILLGHANTTPMGAVAVRVSAARAAGGWDPACERAADWELWKRVVGRDGARTASTDTATLLHFRDGSRAGVERAQPFQARSNSLSLTHRPAGNVCSFSPTML